MSKIGRKKIQIPDNTNIEILHNIIKVSGPLGELKFNFKSHLKIEKKDNILKIIPQKQTKYVRSLYGLTRSIVYNMIEGVTKGFRKQLELSGVGFRVQISGSKLTFSLGFSHPIEYEIPEGINIKIEKNIITINGIDKQKVGQTAAEIKHLKIPDPYKAKGIKYFGEEIKTKPGKAVAKTMGEGEK